jgi:hypothetical protein
VRSCSDYGLIAQWQTKGLRVFSYAERHWRRRVKVGRDTKFRIGTMRMHFAWLRVGACLLRGDVNA